MFARQNEAEVGDKRGMFIVEEAELDIALRLRYGRKLSIKTERRLRGTTLAVS